MNTITQVTGKNQVTIPAAVTRRYGITAGARLEWRPGARKDEISIRIQPGPAATLHMIRELGDQYVARVPEAAGVLREMRAQEDARRLEALAGQHGGKARRRKS